MPSLRICRAMLILSVLLILPALAPADGPSAPPKPPAAQVAKIESLIKAFGGDDYHASERADAAIRRIGAAAVPILRKHLGGSDEDVAERITNILKYMERLTLISLRANKVIYKLGEPIDLTATFKNEGVAEVVVSLTGLRDLRGLAVITPDGNNIKRDRGYGQPSLADIKLAPGQECSVPMSSINQAKRIRLPKTKRKTLSGRTRYARRAMFNLNRPDTYYLRLHRDGQVSNEVAIRILGPDEEPSPPAANVTVPFVKQSSAQIARLESFIKDLGSESFQTRELAEAEIRKLVSAVAVPALRKHFDDSDAEVADRAARIVADMEWRTLISLRADKVIYKRGEPVNLVATFTNEGVLGAVIDLTALRGLDWLAVVDTSGNKAKRSSGNVRPGKLTGIKLAPGRERSVSMVAINMRTSPKTRRSLRYEWLDLKRPDTYYLRLYWGYQASNEVAIRVLGANEAPSPPDAHVVVQPVKLSPAQIVKFESLIKDLGSKDVQTRERADAAIRKTKPAVAVLALRKHFGGPDADVAKRIAKIVADMEQQTLISLRASKDAYKLGELINMTVTFKNEGIVGTVIDPTALRELDGLTAIDQNGNRVKYGHGNVGLSRLANFQLAPGRERSVSMVAINKFLHPKTRRFLRRKRLDLNRPGTYRLRFSRNGQVSNEVIIEVLEVK